MPRPRVIFINRVYWPSLAATAQLLTDLAEGLAARGSIVHVVAAGNEPGPHQGVTIHRTGEGDHHGGLISRARNYWRFIRRVRQELSVLVQPGDTVVVMTDPPLLGALLAPQIKKKGARMIHWIQDIYPEIVSAHFGSPAGWPLFPLRLKRDAAWRGADICVVLGETMALKVASHGVATRHIAIIPNWAPRELQGAANPVEVTAQRVSWGFADKFIIAYSGNLGRVHEFDTIVGAAKILRDRPDIIFLFIGAGPRLAEVRAMAERKHLSNIHVLPPAPREKLAASLAAADIQLVTLKPDFNSLVYPSKLAGVLAAGRPVIFVGQPEGEIARLLENRKCGVCIPPSDSVSLAETVTRWQANQEERHSHESASRAAYEGIFTFQSALNQWEKTLGPESVQIQP